MGIELANPRRKFQMPVALTGSHGTDWAAVRPNLSPFFWSGPMVYLIYLVWFTFLSWVTAAGLFLPGIILWYIPATETTGEIFLRTSRYVAIAAALTAPYFSFLLLKLLAN
jgi:hypothetical protein